MASVPAADPAQELLDAAAAAEGVAGAMDEAELAALLAAHEAASVSYYTSEIASEQARAIDYYYGRMDDLPALDGCSSVVSHSVQIHVDNGLAAILKPFVSADEVVRFAPRGPEDAALADQATEYVNYVIQCDNPGFRILHDWFKDALLTKLGVVKIWWEDQGRAEVRTVPADDAGLLAARQSENYLGEEATDLPGVHAVKMQERIEDGRIRIENVPPEEFLVSPLSRAIETAPYVAHRPGHFTRSDLIEMGVDAEIADGLPAASAGDPGDPRALARWQDEAWGGEGGLHGASGLADRSRDLIAILDEYVRVDFDGDGVSELRRVVRAGDTILMNEPVDHAPFALLCPVPMPHKIYGRSVADLALEGQKVATAITRQTLDNLYKTNNPRPIVPDSAVNENTWDDLADSAPGAAIRTRVPQAIGWASVPFSANHSFQMLEAIAQHTEERTGVQRKGHGLNPETLKKNSPDTATQAQLDENSRNERAEMTARIFAETGVKRLFVLILHLLQAHQPRARVVRLRNQWVEMDPRGWPEMDVSIAVGLGVGNKAEQVGQAQSVLAAMRQLAGTPYGFLVEAKHVHEAVKRLLVATGIKDVDRFIGDPAKAQPPQPQESPELARAKAEAALKQQQAAFDAQLAQQKAAGEAQREQMKAAAKAELDRSRADFEAGLARDKAAFEAQLAMEKQRFAQEMARARAAERVAGAAFEAREPAPAAEVPDLMPGNRPGGNLAE